MLSRGYGANVAVIAEIWRRALWAPGCGKEWKGRAVILYSGPRMVSSRLNEVYGKERCKGWTEVTG